MIIAESTVERKSAKRKLRNQMKKYNITITNVKERCAFHYNTVRDAFNPETKYWNQDLVNLAESMIEEKKNAAVTA